MSSEASPFHDVLTPSVLEAIHEHAEACHPEECCGLVTRAGVRPSVNHQDVLHAQDPDAFPRTNRDGFHLAPEDQLFLARSFDGDDPVRVLYHSHVDTTAHFSAADHTGATYENEPLYPTLVHLVVAVHAGRVTDTRAYAWDGSAFARVRGR